MRTRKEIEDAGFDNAASSVTVQLIQLEVLLDIRDILVNPPLELTESLDFAQKTSNQD